jgi:multidrug resistance efflux pump
MRVLYGSCALVLVVVAAITLATRGESDSFYGIADAREIVINSESPVDINSIHVVQGQLVGKGDTLVELSRSDLAEQISDYSRRLDDLRNRKTTRIHELQAEIRELEAQYAMNKQLASDLKSIKKDSEGAPNGSSANPIVSKIADLKKELQYEQSVSNPQESQARRLQQELAAFEKIKEGFVIKAQIDGVIGSVNYKNGEKISPFSPIMTLHTKSPSLVRGYIHEKVYTKIAVGQQVRVSSLSGSGNRNIGEVVGVGSRIVEYPVRLRKRQDILIWGREVIVKIPENNAFLLGEKVRIVIGNQGGAQS